ncbi:MAG: glycosyltransferase family 39 protein [Eubacteriales bacterium]
MVAKMKGENLLKIKREAIITICWCFLIACIIITICSRSSFLYPMNNWDDANSYLSMAKALQNGNVLYRDAYDQKGPYLYLLYMFANMISSDSFFGVYIVELIACTFSLVGMYAILRLYLSKKMSMACIPVMASVIYSSVSFYWGGSAEEMMLPALVFAVFISLRYFKNRYPEPMESKEVFFVGLLAGYVMQHKYTSLGLFFAFMMMVACTRLLKKEIKTAFFQSGIFLLGMLIPSVPWLIYFGYHGAIGSWYEAYVYNNIFSYSGVFEKASLGQRAYDLAKILYDLILEHFQYFIFIIIGGFGFIFSTKIKIVEKLNVISMCFFLFLGIFVGGVRLKYYSFSLVVFVPLGLIFVGILLAKIWKLLKIHMSPKICQYSIYGILSAVLIGSSIFAYVRSMNTFLIGYPKEDFYLYQFKEIIEETEDPTLLNINCLDVGLYTVCDIVPTCRFFQGNTVNYDYVLSEQQRYIEEGLIDYVIVRTDFPQYLEGRYEMVKEITNDLEDNQFTYRLYRKIK